MLEEEEDDWEKDWETYNSDEIILPNISKLEEENNLKKIKEKQLVEESDHLLVQELFSNTNTKFVKKEEQTFQKRKPKFIKTQNKEKEKQKEQQKEKLNKIKKKQKDEIFGEAESTDYLQDAYCELEDKY